MARSASTPSSALFSEIEALYPLARILATANQTDRLLLRVAKQAAECPPDERPEDRQSWLLRLLLEERTHLKHEPSAEVDESTDTLLEDIAQERAKEVVPIALASCTTEEQFLIAIDLFGDPGEADMPDLATALDLPESEGRDLRSDAWSTLRDNFHESLSEPEREVVGEAISDERLRDIVRAVLSDRLPTMPSSVRARLRSTLEEADRSRPPKHPQQDAAETDAGGTLSWPRMRTVLAGLIVLALVATGGIGISYWTESPTSSQTSPPRPTLSTFSAQHLSAVEPATETQQPAEIEAFIQTTWNRQVTIPSIADAELRGVGRLRLGPSVDIPVILFDDTPSGDRIAIFAYTYALVDRLDEEVRLNRDHREAIARNRQLVALEDSAESGLLWRDQDDIFVAVASSIDPEALKNRIEW